MTSMNLEKFKKRWQPRLSDTEWTWGLITDLNDGAFWLIPMNQSIWKLDKVNHIFCCIYGSKDDLFWRITVTCDGLGYTTQYVIDTTLTPEVVARLFAEQRKQPTRPLTQTVIQHYLYGMGKTTERTDINPSSNN
jgi:hypothetical protein